MADVVIHAATARINVTGINFLNYAKHYSDCAKCLMSNSNVKMRVDPVPYQLLSQALELNLKAFIWVTEGIGRNTIRNRYGHDLMKLWLHSKSRGIDKYAKVTPLRERSIEVIGPYYKDRKLCYLDIEMMFGGFDKINSEPKLAQTLFRLNVQLNSSLKQPVLRASQNN